MKKKDGYAKVTPNEKMRLSLAAMADKIDEKARDKILLTYNDRKLLKAYENIRNSGIYQKGGGKAHHRKMLEFPNPETFEFVNRTLTALYGENWIQDNKALRHPLVKPWWVIKSI